MRNVGAEKNFSGVPVLLAGPSVCPRTQFADLGANPVGHSAHLLNPALDAVSECMRWLAKQLELSREHRDASIRLGAGEIRLERV